MGDLETEHSRCLLYSQLGDIVVVSVDYRLAPEHPIRPVFRTGIRVCCGRSNKRLLSGSTGPHRARRRERWR